MKLRKSKIDIFEDEEILFDSAKRKGKYSSPKKQLILRAA